MKKKITYIISIAIAMLIVVSSVTAAGAVSNEINFDTHTESLYLLNLDTDTVVYNKAAQEKRYPASTTKIMTYIVVSEQVADLDNTNVTINADVLSQLDGTESSTAGLNEYVGKSLTVTQLLNCMMVSSGNDAALVLADYVGGGDVDKFVDLMNKKAEELGCKGTHYVNPHGLQDEEQYTTAEDLAIITKYALTVKYFPEITNTTEYFLDGEEKDPLTTTNLLITPASDYYYEYAKGIKTGTTDEAGHCLISTALKDGTAYLCVALNAPIYDENGYTLDENYAAVDSKNLYEWAYSNIQMKTIIAEQDKVCETKINYVSNQDMLGLVPEYSYSTMLPKDLDDSKIEIKTQCPEVIDAPVKKGDIIGTATISYNGEELTKVNLVACETLDRSEFLYSMTIAKNIMTSPWFIVAAIVIVILFIAYLIFINRMKKTKTKEVRQPRDL
ncbi:MAG TPA: D-alanyl-D-alanine carboxypeptidase [Clostridiales bacterium]|nr:D-alanyl-D-alanine carboxypeptidase [Clostridiales bacterium]